MFGEAKLIGLSALVLGAWFLVRQHDAGIRAEVEQKHQVAAAAELQANTRKLQELVNANQQLQAARAADRSALADASRRLRERLAGQGIVVRPATPGAVQDAPDTLGMCAQLLSRADERLQLLGKVADERGDALTGCVSAYDTLSKP